MEDDASADIPELWTPHGCVDVDHPRPTEERERDIRKVNAERRYPSLHPPGAPIMADGFLAFFGLGLLLVVPRMAGARIPDVALRGPASSSHGGEGGEGFQSEIDEAGPDGPPIWRAVRLG